jgi:hypothetical protein
MQDKKHLATIHTTRSIDQYWHVRTKTPQGQVFSFQLERTTPNGTKTYQITKGELPNELSKLL